MRARNKPRTALVVGSHGFIGSYISRLLIQLGWKVIGIDALFMYKPEQWDLYQRNFYYRQTELLTGLTKFYRIDASQAVEVLEILQMHKPEIVINVGGSSVADQCKSNIGEAVNSIYLLNANLLQCMKNLESLKRYTYISSSMVYGDFEDNEPTEESPKNPKDPYGAIKLGGEYLVESFNRQFQLPYTIIRPSAVYGPFDSNLRVTGIFMANAFQGIPLRVNDPQELLDFTFVEDVAQGIVHATTSDNGLNQTFNMTRGSARTIHEFAQEIKRHLPDTSVVVGQSDEHMPGLIRPKRGTLSMRKSVELLEYQPSRDIEYGVGKYVESWRRIYGN